MNCITNFSLKKRLVVSSIVLSQILCMSPETVFAADSTVRLAGQAVITNLNSAGSMTAEARAEQVQQNLDNALVASKDRTPASVNITYVKGLPVVTVGGYQVITVDSASAKSAGTTPAVLAQRWADALRGALKDQSSVQSYVAHLSGDYASSAPPATQAPPPPQQTAQQGEYFGSNTPQQYNNYNNAPPPSRGPAYGAQVGYNQQQQQPPGYGAPPPNGYRQGRVAYAPAGLMMDATLATSISTQVARTGDLVQATIGSPINLGEAQIPAGSVLIGQVTDAKGGRYLGLAGKLGVEFNRLRTPDGIETPISAHIEGGIGKYEENKDGVMAGETWKTKAGQGAIRGAAGAGLGAALGTAVGAIAGGKRGAGRGAWSGTAIGGGLGVTQSLVARKGKEVTIPSGTRIKVQLDQPVTLAGGGPLPYSGAY